jgi:hypothetical protein
MNDLESHHQLVTDLQVGIEQHFRKIHAEHRSEFPDFIEFLEQHLLFITVDFAPRSGGDVNGTNKCLHQFGGYFFKLCKFVMGSSLDRKFKYQPVTYAFLDFEGSRSAGSVDIKTSDFPHVHALMLVHPEYRDVLRCLADSPAFWVKNIDNIVVKRFRAEIGEKQRWTKNGFRLRSLRRLISYSMKGFTKANPADKDSDFYRCEFPRRGCKTTPVRRDSKGSPVCGLHGDEAINK